MQEPSHIETCSNKNIEMNVESYHKYPVACISISSHRIVDLCEPFSVVFIASADNITFLVTVGQKRNLSAGLSMPSEIQLSKTNRTRFITL